MPAAVRITSTWPTICRLAARMPIFSGIRACFAAPVCCARPIRPPPGAAMAANIAVFRKARRAAGLFVCTKLFLVSPASVREVALGKLQSAGAAQAAVIESVQRARVFTAACHPFRRPLVDSSLRSGRCNVDQHRADPARTGRFPAPVVVPGWHRRAVQPFSIRRSTGYDIVVMMLMPKIRIEWPTSAASRWISPLVSGSGG